MTLERRSLPSSDQLAPRMGRVPHSGLENSDVFRLHGAQLRVSAPDTRDRIRSVAQQAPGRWLGRAGAPVQLVRCTLPLTTATHRQLRRGGAANRLAFERRATRAMRQMKKERILRPSVRGREHDDFDRLGRTRRFGGREYWRRGAVRAGWWAESKNAARTRQAARRGQHRRARRSRSDDGIRSIRRWRSSRRP